MTRLQRVMLVVAEGQQALMFKASATKLCEPVIINGQCDNRHPARKTMACSSRRCLQPCCRRHVSKERAAHAEELATVAFPIPWAVVVLPYVARLRPFLLRRDLLVAARLEAFRMIERIILESEGLDPKKWWLGAKSVDHPEGDKEEEGTCWKPHHNFLWPTVAFGKGPGRENERKTLKYLLRPETLKLMRQGWAAFQSRMLIAFGMKPLRGEANMFYEFRIDEAKKRHMARYFFRSFPSWDPKAQRIVGFSAFGCQIIKKLNETHVPPVVPPDPDECRRCKGRVTYETVTVPQHFHTVSRGPAP